MNDYTLVKMVEFREDALRRKNEHDMQVNEARQQHNSRNRFSRLFKGRGRS